MTNEAKKLATELNLYPTIPVSEEEKQTLNPEDWFISDKDGSVRYDYSLSDSDILLIAELKKCKNIKTIKNIAVSAAVLVAVNAFAILYFVFKVAALL